MNQNFIERAFDPAFKLVPVRVVPDTYLITTRPDENNTQ